MDPQLAIKGMRPPTTQPHKNSWVIPHVLGHHVPYKNECDTGCKPHPRCSSLVEFLLGHGQLAVYIIGGSIISHKPIVDPTTDDASCKSSKKHNKPSTLFSLSRFLRSKHCAIRQYCKLSTFMRIKIRMCCQLLRKAERLGLETVSQALVMDNDSAEPEAKGHRDHSNQELETDEAKLIGPLE